MSADLTGLEYGRLVVRGAAPASEVGRRRWRAVCECGTEAWMTHVDLCVRRRAFFQCGCAQQNGSTLPELDGPPRVLGPNIPVPPALPRPSKPRPVPPGTAVQVRAGEDLRAAMERVLQLADRTGVAPMLRTVAGELLTLDQAAGVVWQRTQRVG